MDFTAHRRRLSPTSLRASAYLIGELLSPPANRRAPLTTHERRDGHPIGRHRNADRQCETPRDVRRRDHVLADDELRLCLLILVLLPLLVLVAKFFGRRLKSLSTSIQDQTAALSTLIEEVISGIRIVKSFVQTQREETRFAAQVEQTLALTMQRAGVMAVFIPVISLLTFAAAAAVLWYGG